MRIKQYIQKCCKRNMETLRLKERRGYKKNKVSHVSGVIP